jgi:sensor histidine kinase YesM
MNSKLKKWLKIHKAHLWAWGVYIAYETIIAGILYNLWGHPLVYFFHYLATIPLFYLHANIAMPWAFRDKGQAIVKLPLIVFVQIVVYVVAHYLVDVFLITTTIIAQRGPYEFNSSFILRNTYRGFFFMGFSTGYYFLKTYLQERERTVFLEKTQLNATIKQKNTEQELFKAQNAFLKAQINPHFLFNTLDFIYHKVSASSPEAADAVISLAEMMRYAITSDERGGTITLEDEMEQMLNLINLFKLRKTQVFYLKVNFAQDTKHLRFIPLVLLTITENIFKHGQLHEADHEATLEVYIENETLFLETRNLSQPQKSNRSNTGLANIKDRLTYAYGDQINFDHTTDAQQYFKLRIGVPIARLNAHAQ